ncbi:MAG: hypothetical protein J7497_12465, partial [Chitinophagaceae bacterium]|nr:hypothetical protein [Chitinophagaceae bacterium]
ANGVILITTKKGKKGKTKLNLNAYTGRSDASRTIDMMDTKQYVAMRKEALANDSIIPTNINAYDLNVFDTTKYTDWKKEFLKNNATISDITASLSGGSSNT